ncbi:transcription factor/nuclear export subunit protein 2-domain-containing protein [Protomyces lactucae-debilis]|uniref:THO complex subunit 2 n=1 Tax=Protomyces lactucae-debilis TaxID=2754530 RepID=A0A1Y2F0K6_PROLT|nr:transcription factor/nuclear export subunit protein 2-domain-containing protein [Protomyces lactucae-debilis]ORY77024.1 transcription factor/nuclear export subunit protein 2-domain-containing protein [Protomyces lactucae-debilis]
MSRIMEDARMLQQLAQLQTLVDDIALDHCGPQDAERQLHQLAEQTEESGQRSDALIDCLWRASTIGAVHDLDDDAAVEEASERLARLGSLVQHLNSTGFLNRDILCERLDPALLQHAKLIPDAQAFSKREVRFRTALLYKQQKFNLLREENEGYSKLVAEFDAFIAATPNEAATPRAKQLMTNIQSLIGFFDLDPNRVLDVLADLAAKQLACHWRFLLAFFKISPWFLHDQQPVRPCTCSADLSGRTGNANAAQIMGFKFAGLTGEDDAQGLLLLMALWIKEGMLKLTDLWPHLAPDEETFANGKRLYREQLDNEKDKARGGNMLAMAGALADDDDAPAAPVRSAQRAEPMQFDTPQEAIQPVNHRQQLVHALIAVGSIPEVMFLLAEYPFLLGLYPAMADSFCILIGQVFQPLADQLRPQQQYTPEVMASLRQGKAFSSDTKYRDSKLTLPPAPRTRHVLNPNPTFSTPQLVERFFYDESASQLQQCNSLTDFGELVMPYLRIAGVHIHRHAKLLSKIALVGYTAIREQPDLRDFWLTVLRTSLLPALSLLETNPAVVNDVYKLVESYDREQRYSLYGEWHTSLYKTIPELRVQLIKTEKETKGTLRRISKTNIPEFGRLLSKSSHSNPCVVLSIALNQIESYDNLVEVVIEASRYFTFMTFDVLAYILLTLLSNNIKRRLKEDGTSVAHWLQSLSSFTAKIYKRYSHLDPVPIVTYVAKQLKIDNAFDLIILQDFITEMGGIRPSSDLSEEQLLGCTGGPLLRAEALSLINERQEVTAKTALRLLDALERTSLTVPFALMIGYQRDCSIYRIEEETLLVKLLANLQDTSHSILIQYLDFLSTYLDGRLNELAMPSISDLVLGANLQPVVAFMIARPGLLAAVRDYNARTSAHLRKAAEMETAADDATETAKPIQDDAGKEEEKMEAQENYMQDDDEDLTPVPSSDHGEDDIKPETTQDVEMKDEQPEDNLMESSTAEDTELEKSPIEFHPVISDLTDGIIDLLPEATWNTLPPRLYVTFWSLDLYDLSVPVERYAKEIKAIRNSIKENQQVNKEDMYTAIRAKEAEVKRLEALIPGLQAEMKTQMQNHDFIMNQLAKEQLTWYGVTTDEEAHASRAHSFLQHCILPRALVSPNDASYCARFIAFLHQTKVSNLSMTHLYEELFGAHLSTSIFTSTEREVENLGKFLGEVLKALNKLQSSESTYNAMPVLLTAPKSEEEDSLVMSFEDFKSMWYKFHRSLWTCVKTCSGSKEFMHIRNILIVLEKMSASYPHFKWVGSNISRDVDRLIASETRESLKIRALSYKAVLKRQQGRWVDVPGKQSAVAGDASKQPTPATSPSQLKATASPFEPRGSVPQPMSELPKSPNAVRSDRGEKSQPDRTNTPAGARDGQASSSPRVRVPSSPKDSHRASQIDQVRDAEKSRSNSRTASPRTEKSSDRPGRSDHPADREPVRREKDLLHSDNRSSRNMPPPVSDLEPGRLNGPPVKNARLESRSGRSDDRTSRDWRIQEPARGDGGRSRNAHGGSDARGGRRDERDSQDGRDAPRKDGVRRDGRDRPSSREGSNGQADSRGRRDDGGRRELIQHHLRNELPDRTKSEQAPVEAPSGPRRASADVRVPGSTILRENGKSYSVALSIKDSMADGGDARRDSRQSQRTDAPAKSSQKAESTKDAPGPYVHPSRLAEEKSSEGRNTEGHAVHPSRLKVNERGNSSPPRSRGSGSGSGGAIDRQGSHHNQAKNDRGSGSGRRDGRAAEQARSGAEEGAGSRSGGRAGAREQGQGKRHPDDGPSGASRPRSPARGGKRQQSGYEGEGRGGRDTKRARR